VDFTILTFATVLSGSRDANVEINPLGVEVTLRVKYDRLRSIWIRSDAADYRLNHMTR